MRSNPRVDNDIYVSAPRYTARFDHEAVVAALTRTYSQRGIAVRSEPTLPGGKRSDLAVSLGHDWTYIEVKTRNGTRNNRGNTSQRQSFLREIMRLHAHSLKQLPRKELSLVVLSASASPDRRKAVSKITIARSLASRIFGQDSEKVVGLMIFAPFRSTRKSPTGWRYASALISNPNCKNTSVKFDRLSSIQL
jgi:hypothetical protein